MNRLRAFCDRICDRLYESIESSVCLSPAEKRVLWELWTCAAVRTQTVEEYPGHAAFASRAGMSRQRLTDALQKLERKGFIKATGSATRGRQLAYLLNALLLESAFDITSANRRRPS